MPATLRLAYREFVGSERALARQAAAYADLHLGFTLEAHPFALADLYHDMVVRGSARTDRYDLWLAVTDWLPEIMRDGLLLPLDDFLAASPPLDWPHGWPDSLRRLQTDAQGRVYGLPYHDGPEVLMYRADLF